MTDTTDLDDAIDHMEEFAERTGLTSDREPNRYLWTDAFAVCNFLGLARATGDERYRQRARKLIEQVHDVLGRHRDDDEREGWLGGLSDEEAREPPTRGGLRIGKPLPERPPGQPIDRDEEWDRDGQYFHYNTKWMHALDLMARDTGEATYNRWARELAKASHDGFVETSGEVGSPRMSWKMRIDLSEPLVESMGETDPSDGFGTYRQLQATGDAIESDEGPDLKDELQSFKSMLDPHRPDATDPLSIGGILMQAHREYQLLTHTDRGDREWFRTLLASSRRGLESYATGSKLQQPAARRLAFRELGLAIGLHGIETMIDAFDETSVIPSGSPEHRHLNALDNHVGTGRMIVDFWRHSRYHDVDTWTEHEDINQVMLASALAPTGYLEWPRD